MIVRFSALVICYSINIYLGVGQQLEWVKLFSNQGVKAQNAPLNNEICNIFEFNGKILLSGKTNGDKIDTDPSTDQNFLYPSGYKNSDIYFVLLNATGTLLNSGMVYTPNGGLDYFSPFAYSNFDKLLRVGLCSGSDSIRFDTSMPWMRKHRNTVFLVFYDSLLSFQREIPIYSNNACIIKDVSCDDSGNTIICGSFKDSLLINGKLMAIDKNNSSFIIKLNVLDSVIWKSIGSNLEIIGNSFASKKLMKLNKDNTIDQIMTIKANSIGTFHSMNDSLNFPLEINKIQHILLTIDLNTGKITKNAIIKSDNTEVRITELKGDNNYILLAGFGKNCTLQIANRNYILNSNKLNGGIPFVSCFDAASLSEINTNVFDSSEIFLSVSEIFNDSLYYVFGASTGNQVFDFRNSEISSSDFLSKNRINGFNTTDFFALYSIDNNLLSVWQLPPSNPLISTSLYQSSRLLNQNGNLYICGNVQYPQNLGLGNRPFVWSSGSVSDISLLKYNCKPTAFFNYSSVNRTVQFKNLSSFSNTYSWDFGVGAAVSSLKNPSYEYASFGATYTPSLTVSNDCGQDKFSIQMQLLGIDKKKYEISRISVFPNPANDIINLELVGGEYIQGINVYDMHGIKVNGYTPEVDTTIYCVSSACLSSGSYIVEVISNKTVYHSIVMIAR